MFFGLEGELKVSDALLSMTAHLGLFLLAFWAVMQLFGLGWAAIPVRDTPKQNATGTGGKWSPPNSIRPNTPQPYVPLPGVAVL